MNYRSFGPFVRRSTNGGEIELTPPPPPGLTNVHDVCASVLTASPAGEQNVVSDPKLSVIRASEPTFADLKQYIIAADWN